VRGWLYIALVTGCYNPSFQPGRPCTEDFYCPGDQQCDRTQSPPTCVGSSSDGGTDGSDGSDGGLDPDASLMPDGPIVPCANGCPTSAPICEQTTQTCRACIADAECPSDVCHEMTGECVAEADAMYVAPTGSGTTCTRTAPCGTVELANNLLTATRRTIKVANGVYTDRLELKSRIGAPSLVLSGPDRSAPGPEFASTLGSNKTQNGLTAVIEGVTIRDAEQSGLECQGPTTLARVHIRNSREEGVVTRGETVRILDSKIETSGATGVVVNGGLVEIERSQILTNTTGGLRIEGSAAYSVINTVIAFNGSSIGSGTGVRILGTAPPSGPQVFRFNTVARNRSQLATTVGVECGRPVTIESSILANNPGILNPELSGMCTATTSLFQMSAPAAGGNIAGDPMFVSASDCHLLAGSPAVNAAPVAGAPSVDLDGDQRSGADAPDIGADEVP
jgi:hypothetical protein